MNPSSTLQPILEHIGISVAAITGVLAARGKRIDLFGVLVLALVTAFGGGTVRDLLVGDLPPVWLRSSDYLLNATVTALVTFFVIRLRSLPGRVLVVADAWAQVVDVERATEGLAGCGRVRRHQHRFDLDIEEVLDCGSRARAEPVLEPA